MGGLRDYPIKIEVDAAAIKRLRQSIAQFERTVIESTPALVEATQEASVAVADAGLAFAGLASILRQKIPYVDAK